MNLIIWGTTYHSLPNATSYIFIFYDCSLIKKIYNCMSNWSKRYPLTLLRDHEKLLIVVSVCELDNHQTRGFKIVAILNNYSNIFLKELTFLRTSHSKRQQLVENTQTSNCQLLYLPVITKSSQSNNVTRGHHFITLQN